MICRNHQHILLTHRCQKFRQALIEVRQCFCVALDIIAVSVEHVVIHQIRKAQSVKILLHIIKRLVDAVLISGRADILRDALLRENIDDLTDRKHVKTGSRELV